MNKIIFHFHIPKTGGSSLRTHFRQHLGKAGFVFMPSKEAVRKDLFNYPMEELSHAKILTGHDLHWAHRELFKDREILPLIVLREPAARMISHYNFQMGEYTQNGRPVVKFDDWYKTVIANPIVGFLAHRLLGDYRPWHWYGHDDLKAPTQSECEQVLEVLKKNNFLVARLSTMESDLSGLCRDFSIPSTFDAKKNVSGRDHDLKLKLNGKLFERINAENPLDFQLWKHFES